MEVLAQEVGRSADALARGVVDPCGDVRGHGDGGMGVRFVEDRVDFLEGGVHPRVDVGVLHRVVALVVDDRAPASAFVNPACACGQVCAGARFVAQAPAEDRGVVLVSLEGAGGAIQIGLDPARVVGGVVDPLPRAFESVRLNISLEHDPQSDLVGKVEQARVRRVVGGSNRVDAHRFHEGQVLPGPPLVEDAPLVGANLVAIDPVERQGRAVGPEDAVDDVDASEAHPQASPRVGTALHEHAHAVEYRILGAPRTHDSHLDALAAVAPVGASTQVDAVGVTALDLEARREGVVHGCEDPRLDGREAHPALVVGVDPQIVEASGSEVAKAHGAEDAREPPLVLVLQVGTGTKLVDPHRERVVSGSYHVGDVEFVGEPRTSRHPDPAAVDPDAGLAFDAIETQGDESRVPPCGKREAAAVVADGVRLRREWWVNREGKVDVRVSGVTESALTAQHPVTRHVDLGHLPRGVQRQ